jgi:hypothetical protein
MTHNSRSPEDVLKTIKDEKIECPHRSLEARSKPQATELKPVSDR